MDPDPAAPSAPETARAPVPTPVRPDQWPSLAEFIFRCNRTADGRVRCLHGDQGDDELRHVAELAELKDGEAALWHARGTRGETLGVIGCAIDGVLQRAWIRGPWAAPVVRSASIECTLLDALERGLPGVHRFDAFPSEDDRALNTLYTGAGYQHLGVHRVMQAVLGDAGAAVATDARVQPARPEDLGQWLPLHHGLFPGSYLSDDEIAAATGDSRHLVLTAWLEGRCAGYLVAKDDATADELYVDYLGVDPACRGRGLGRTLLLQAIRWGAGRGRRHGALTVRQDRAEALSLYQQCGFQQVCAGVHWRKDRLPVADSSAGEC